MTRVCIYGAGAVGSHVAVRLAGVPGVDVSVVARGVHLQAIKAQGLTLLTEDGKLHAAINTAVDDAADLPPQDIVIVSLKANALSAHSAAIATLLKPDGVALFLNNGIPWWWHYGLPTGAVDNGDPGLAMDLLDHDRALWTELGPQRVIGGVVQSPNELEAPGVVRHRGHNRFLLGEPDLSRSPRLRALYQLFDAAGLNPELPLDIRQAVWEKLLINLPGNPISALTRLDTHERTCDPGLQMLGYTLQQEIRRVASAMGWELAAPALPGTQAAPAKTLNARPSMLQDVLRGRPLEVDALLGQPLAFARQHGVATPALDVLYPLLRGLAQSLSAPAGTC